MLNQRKVDSSMQILQSIFPKVSMEATGSKPNDEYDSADDVM